MAEIEIKEIKRLIYEEDSVAEILSKLGCHSIKKTKSNKHNSYIYKACRPDGDNSSSVQVILEQELRSVIYTRGVKGDIFTIIYCLINDEYDSQKANKNVFDALIWLSENFNYSFYGTDKVDYEFSTEFDDNNLLDFVNEAKKKRKKNIPDIVENKKLDHSILTPYIDMGNIWWQREGIDYETQNEFGIRFCPITHRIIIPCHDKHGNLIGTKGRLSPIIDSDESKYLYMHGFNKSVELFNLHRALPYIKEKNEMIIFEGAKSVMKSWSYGVKNCVSIEGFDISPEQAYMIVQNTKLDTKIRIVFDKYSYNKNLTEDEMFNIHKEYLIHQKKKIKHRITGCYLDKQNILDYSECIADKDKFTYLKNIYLGKNYI